MALKSDFHLCNIRSSKASYITGDYSTMATHLRKRYLEAISVSSASLSLSNITKFYFSYIKENTDKVRGQLDRNGYFLRIKSLQEIAALTLETFTFRHISLM